MSSHNPRFSGIARLYGDDGFARIQSAHICVVGIGGVGSWAVEALARTGVGTLTLIDLDDVCVSNVNRQIHALDGWIGKPKVAVMEERIRAIHPTCDIRCVHRYVSIKNIQELITTDMHYVFDAIDAVPEKCALIAHCKELSIPCITAGGAGGRRSSSAVIIKDLSRSFNDPLLLRVRKILRRDHGFTRSKKKKFKIDCVFSPETIHYPEAENCDANERKQGSEMGLNCDSGFGTASFVTGAFGFAAAAHIIQQIAIPTVVLRFVEPYPETEEEESPEAEQALDKSAPDSPDG